MKKQLVLTIVYVLLTLAFLALAIGYGIRMHKVEQMGASYFETQRWLLLLGAVLGGTGWTIRKAYTVEARFLVPLGGVLLVYTVVMFLLFGGMTTPFDATGYTVANVQLLMVYAAGLACWIRSVVAALGLRDASVGVKSVARLLVAAVAVAAVCLIITGTGTRMARYDESAQAAYTESAY